jgi:peptide/nickel transport system substrate-binding protein
VLHFLSDAVTQQTLLTHGKYEIKIKMSISSKRNKTIVASVVLIAIIAVGVGYYVTQSSTTMTTATTAMATATTAMSSGVPVPNNDTFVEETARLPGPGATDPAASWDPGGNFLHENIYETLMTYNGPHSDQFIPWLAESYDVSPDGLVYTFHLRQGITFQDGTPFNATAVKYSLDRAVLMNYPNGAEYLISANETMAIKGAPRYFNAETTNVYNETEAKIYLAAGGVKVIDPYTVQITIEHPYAATIATMAFTVTSIVSPTYVIANCPGSAEMPGVMPGIACDFMETHAMGTGPWKLVEYTPQVRTVLERYDGYWGTPSNTGPAKLKRYEIRFVPEVATRELDLYAGTADGIELPASNAFDLIDQNAWLNNHTIVSLKAGIRVWSAPTIAISAMTLNPRFPPMNDIRFRMALAYAFPYSEYIKEVVNGFGVKLNALLPVGMFGADPTIQGYNYNPDMAKQLFQQVGFNGTLTITVIQGLADDVTGAVLFKDSIGQIYPAMTVKVNELDAPTVNTLTRAKKLPLEFGGWYPDISDGAETIAAFAAPDGQRARVAEFFNTTITTMVNEAASSLNTTLRLALYREIQLEMLRKVAYIPTYVPVALMAERTWVLPSDSPIGRGLYNPEYGDGSGGVEGGYHAYYVWKAQTTQQINIDIGGTQVLAVISPTTIATTPTTIVTAKDNDLAVISPTTIATTPTTIVTAKNNYFAASWTPIRYMIL